MPDNQRKEAVPVFLDYMFTLSQYTVIFFTAAVLLRCLRSMLSERDEPEVWAFVRAGHDTIPVFHWENIIGRARSSDIRIFGRGIGRVHAVLSRNDSGDWTVADVFSKGGVWVNGERVPKSGAYVQHGDIVNLGGSCVRFLDISEEQREENERHRTSAGKRVAPEITLLDLTIVQLSILFQHYLSADKKNLSLICISYLVLIILEWTMYEAMRIVEKSGFEIESLAFLLTTFGLCIAAGATPEDVYKQILLIVTSVIMFLISGWWMRNLHRTKALRIPVALFALALLALNIFTSDSINGAKNWLEIGGYSFQPSEFVKTFYIYVGAASLESLYRKRNLYAFTVFSAICVVALALIGDFGTALIFFATFLVISFMRSGSLATVVLAVTGAALAGFLAISVKPYIAKRFEIWGHAWEDVYDAGYQQTRAMSASAAGGLVGKGAGAGWLKNVVYSDTDMAFAYICEELGLVVAVLMVLCVILMAFFAVRTARHGRSTYYAIAACASSAMLLVQLALNVFGSVDMLPFTGVTFPFVSRGGSSLISCWMLMAYLKSSDNRRDASFAVEKGELRDTQAALRTIHRERWENDYEEEDVPLIVQHEKGKKSRREKRAKRREEKEKAHRRSSPNSKEKMKDTEKPEKRPKRLIRRRRKDRADE